MVDNESSRVRRAGFSGVANLRSTIRNQLRRLITLPRHKHIAAFLGVVFVAAAIVAPRIAAQQAPSGEPDMLDLQFGITSHTGYEITSAGLHQTFQIEQSQDSPLCDGNQAWAVSSAEFLIEVPEPENQPISCEVALEAIAEIKDSAGKVLASARTWFLGPNSPTWVKVRFDPPVILNITQQYTLSIRREGYDAMAINGSPSAIVGHPHIQPSMGPSGSTLLHQSFCPDSYSFLPAFLKADTSNQYLRGDLVGHPGTDAREILHGRYVVTVSPLVVIYDPKIGDVTYTDTYGTLTFSHGNDRLHQVMGFPDPVNTARSLVNEINNNTGGAVVVELDEDNIILLDDQWAPHDPAQEVWWDTVLGLDLVRLKTIPGWTAWTNNTYPGYPDLDDWRRRVDFPDGWGSPPPGGYLESIIPAQTFNYQSVFDLELDAGTHERVRDRVNSGAVTDLWVFGDSTTRLAEAAIAMPQGDSSTFNNIGSNEPINGLTRRISVMGFNLSSGPGNTLHSFLHRVESTVGRVYNNGTGHSIPRYCSQITGARNFFYIGNCPNNTRGFGSIGLVHRAWNAPNDPAFLTDLWAPDWVAFQDSVPTDEQDWYSYPNFGTPPYAGKDCTEHGDCTGQFEPYYHWFLDHIPRNEGIDQGGDYSNLWPYVFHMSCFPNL